MKGDGGQAGCSIEIARQQNQREACLFLRYQEGNQPDEMPSWTSRDFRGCTTHLRKRE